MRVLSLFMSTLVTSALVTSGFALALLGTPVLADNDTHVAQQKLDELRQHRKDLQNRHRAAILIVNQTPVGGIENNLHDEAAILFSSNGHEIVNLPDSASIVAGHTKGAPFTVDELARIADQLQVETIAVGTVTDYRAKRDIGLPLPTMSVRTEARVKMNGLVYKRSANQVVWQDSINKVNRQFVGGSFMSRNQTRRRTSESVIDTLFTRYFNKKS